MRRILATLGAVAVAGTMMAVPASAHVADVCGESNSLNPFDHTALEGTYPYAGRKTYTVDLEAAGAGTYYVDDRDYVAWYLWVGIPTDLANNVLKDGSVGWDVSEQDHAGGIWIYEEKGNKKGLQRGGDAEKTFGQLPSDVKDAFYENVGTSEDPCKQGEKKFWDHVIF